MTRPMRKRISALSGHGRGVPLDATACEAVERFVRVLARCGCSASDILAAFREACERLPTKSHGERNTAQRELRNASHILTVWFSDALYLDHSGKPIALPVRGTPPSLESLVARVDPTLDVEDLVRYLRRVKALKREGSFYTPRKRILSLRGAQGPEVFRNLRSLVGLLRTLEHNMQPKSVARSWFEYWAENPAFPVRARAAFDARLDELGMKFLHAIDADMHRCEVERKPGDRTVRIGVGVYRFEDDGPSENRPISEGGRPRQGARRRRGRRAR